MSLCILQNDWSIKSFPRRAKNRAFFCKEIPLCSLRRRRRRAKASFTLEAVIVIPLTLSFLIGFLFFFRIMEFQRRVDYALDYACRRTATLEMKENQSILTLAKAQLFFQQELGEGDNSLVVGGRSGVILLGSEIKKEQVKLKASYVIKVPIALLPFPPIPVVQECVSRRWIGDENRRSQEAEEYVYVTDTGRVYHLDLSCKYLDLSIHSITYPELSNARNKEGSRYGECKLCKKSGGGDFVYITDYGENYHRDLGCMGLKRTVNRIPISQVGDKKLCSKCKKNHKE